MNRFIPNILITAFGAVCIACADPQPVHLDGAAAAKGSSPAVTPTIAPPLVSKMDAPTAEPHDVVNPPAVVSLPTTTPVYPAAAAPVPVATPTRPSGHYETRYGGWRGRQVYTVWVNDQPRQPVRQQPVYYYRVNGGCARCGR